MGRHLPFSMSSSRGNRPPAGKGRNGSASMTIRIETRRLVLRPFAAGDAAAVESSVSRWEIAAMTTRIAHPYPAGAAAAWIDDQQAAREQGNEHTFAITLQGQDQPIGAISLRHSEPGN